MKLKGYAFVKESSLPPSFEVYAFSTKEEAVDSFLKKVRHYCKENHLTDKEIVDVLDESLDYLEWTDEEDRPDLHLFVTELD